MFRSFPAFSLLRAARSCSIFSGLLLVSQSLGSILSRPQTVTLSFYPSPPLKHTANTRATHAHTHAHACTHARILSFSLTPDHRHIRISV